MNNLFLKSFCSLLLVSFLLVVGCKKDDNPTPTTKDVIASFQFVISGTNFLEVTFTNFSQNATSYSWDFGDGNSSTEEDPTHTYAAAGNYTATVTATGSDGKTASKSESFTLTDPNTASSLLAGTSSKTWYLQREGIALGIGPAANDNQWWSFGGATALGDRPCILDDFFTFHTNGTWEKNTNGTLYVDAPANGGWGPSEGCHDEGEAGILTSDMGEDLSAFASGGSYTYDYDVAGGQLTITGSGAYIGLPNKTGTGDNYIPQSTKTYEVFRLVEGAVADSLQIAIAINGGAGGYWNFYLISYHNPADLPDIPSSMPKANFSYFKSGFTVDFTNSSINSTSYSWDFGDGGMSSENNPTHTYSAEGNYTVTLTAMDAMGGSDQKSEVISISTAAFTAAALSSAAGKVWRLDGEGSYFVGPTAGSSEWWGGLDATGVVERACQMDDEFIFTDGGKFEYASQGQVWAEDYMKGAFACTDDAALVSPFDAFGSAVHSFSATDINITVTGNGAYLGFNKAYNGGELPAEGSGMPASELTSEVLEYTNASGVEKLTITVDYSANQDGTAYWSMRLISQ